eukprot:gnl/Spiro4/17584_TR9372_c0_g1_i1.p1 gnl/Spiro4/17584_TR9372_c0_g1~~gnl/Spiro4/17584_TR9372_c0_g1_i1.p1  ORF type:complete len:382 (-),score=-21.57 gnl/Spiro4/17584_TR9372_c0_g1_i1:609-1754(-)
MNEKDEKEPTLAQEAGLPDSWKPVDVEPIVPSRSSVPNQTPNPMAPYFSGSISPTLQHDAIFVGTKYGTYGIPSLPLMPLSPSGQPSVGSAVQSGSSTTIVNSGAGVPSLPTGSIQFNNGGAFGGSSLLTWNNVSGILNVIGNTNITGTLTVTGSVAASLNVTAIIFNASTGFQIGGAAGTGKYLRGNGTNLVSATLSGTDVLTGLVGVTYGGTGSNLSATGGASEVLLQTTVGGAVTVRQLTFADISGTISPGEIVSGSINLTAQTANVSASTLFAVGASGAGQYLVTIYMIVSQAATVSSTLPDSRIIFTDQDSGATITTPITSGITTNTTSTFTQGTFVVNAKASTNVQYDVGQVTPYASSGATPMQFSYRARIIYLG